jgi:hypothetical protein
LQKEPPIYGIITSRRFIMDQTKAVYTGMAVGGIAGFGGAILSAFTVVALAPVAGAFVAGVAIVGGAIVGGSAALKIAEKVNHKEKDQEV